MIVETFPVGMLACNCTILGDSESGEAIVIDGGDDVAAIAARLDRYGLTPRYLVHTHAHFDHIGCLGALRERCGGAGLLHHADRPLYATVAAQARMFGLPETYSPVALDGDLTDGDELRAGAISLRAIHTPGHTPGSTTFALEDGDATTLFTDIVDSIRTKLLVYPDDAHVVAGHGPSTTIGIERATNPFLT
jgi:glyoxylase-like metal-dependent hydrolase (beta-lactamase superfamily II)